MSVIQAICLFVGLWMQDRFVLTLADWNLNRQSSGATQETAVKVTDRASEITSAMYQARPLAFLWICGLQSIVAYLLITRIHLQHEQQQEISHSTLVMRAKELVRTRDAVTFGLAKLAESRDSDTGRHLERIALYSTRLATALRRHPKFRAEIQPSFIQTLGVSSALHDIGKVGIPDGILLKPGPLTDDERQTMQTHAMTGGDCLRQVEKRIGFDSFLSMAREIAYHHHERWDGTGYPDKLSGEAIPLPARIVAIADVYDALVSKRTYKDAFSHEKSIEIIRAEAGKQFDPEMVEVLLTIQSQFKQVSDRYRDQPLEEMQSISETSDSRRTNFKESPAESELLETVRNIHEETKHLHESVEESHEEILA